MLDSPKAREDRLEPLIDTALLEPKTLFANERTFLHYIQKAFFLGVVSIMLLANPMHTFFGTMGLILGAASITYMIWSYIVFRERISVIKSRRNVIKSMRFDEPMGPIVVYSTMVMIGLVSLMHFLAKFRLPHHWFSASEIQANGDRFLPIKLFLHSFVVN